MSADQALRSFLIDGCMQLQQMENTLREVAGPGAAVPEDVLPLLRSMMRRAERVARLSAVLARVEAPAASATQAAAPAPQPSVPPSAWAEFPLMGPALFGEEGRGDGA
jgi:hypothetical protein